VKYDVDLSGLFQALSEAKDKTSANVWRPSDQMPRRHEGQIPISCLKNSNVVCSVFSGWSRMALNDAGVEISEKNSEKQVIELKILWLRFFLQ
jgi:hypothetical protein